MVMALCFTNTILNKFHLTLIFLNLYTGITSLEDLKVLSTCVCLSVLNIEGNPVAELIKPDGVLSAIPSLKTLDGVQLKT